MTPIELAAAFQIIDQEVEHSWGDSSHQIELPYATHRILAEDVFAPFDHPPKSQSLRDGVAFAAPGITSEAVQGVANPADSFANDIYRLVGTVFPGQATDLTLTPGTAARIMTGAAIPAGSTGVAMLEDLSWLQIGPEGWQVVEANWAAAQRASHVHLKVRPQPDAFVLAQGSIFQGNERLLTRGARINPVTVGLLASAGLTHVACVRQPRIAVLVTGDELVPAGTPKNLEQIYNSNGPLLDAAFRELGFPNIGWQHIPDSETQIADWLRTRLGEYDLVVTTGAVSAGQKDCLPKIFQELGICPLFHGVRIKPGKPVFLGRWQQPHYRESAAPTRSTYVFGLPGNPISVWVTFQLLVRRAVERLGGSHHTPKWMTARLNQGGNYQDSRLTFWPGRIEWPATPWVKDLTSDSWVNSQQDGAIQVTALPWLGSPDLRTPTEANSLICFPANSGQLDSGAQVVVMVF